MFCENKTDYRRTLNLPQTDFPMKGNLPTHEIKILNHWNNINAYDVISFNKGETFILHDGPPYANGDIHIGHAVNKILKDIIVKSQKLNGKRVLFKPGFDCHGLPIELAVEKLNGKKTIETEKFLDLCKLYAENQVYTQILSFKRLGVLADWENPYLTSNNNIEAATLRAFAKIFKNGHVEKGYKPVHYCFDCGSSLADAEVEYVNKTSFALDVKFRVSKEFTNENFLANLHNVFMVVWTTTPWTLPVNKGVAVNQELTYSLIKTDKEYLIVAKDLLIPLCKKYGIINYTIIDEFTGLALSGIYLQHPFYDIIVPVVSSNHVTNESGTGIVHIAPSHGHDDFIVGKTYSLDTKSHVLQNGTFDESVKYFKDKHIFSINEEVIKLLEENGNLLHKEIIQHSYPHCWRHKKPIIINATSQWFISMDKNHLREKALAEIDNVSWIPSWGQAKMSDMIKNRPDWCISRQRKWGVPLTLFTHKITEELHPDTLNILEKAANIIQEGGIKSLISTPSSELIGSDDKYYDRSEDVLDVWFDSGVTHESVLALENNTYCPADVYFEGSDQFRGWFQSSLLTSVAIHGKAPFKKVIAHGFVVDSVGRKMSKSLGNVIDPQKVVKTYGADILRLWAASVDYTTEISISDNSLKQIANLYKNIRNTIRFLLANLSDYNPFEDFIEPWVMLPFDQYIIKITYDLQNEIIQHYDNYEFYKVFQKIHSFCNNELSSIYLDIIKDRQYTMNKNNLARRSAQTAIYYILNALVRWISPILSFTAEEVWKIDHVRGSVFENIWYDKLFTGYSGKGFNDDFWKSILDIKKLVTKELDILRTSKQIGSSLEAEITIETSDFSLFSKLNAIKDELKFIFIVSKVMISKYDSFDKETIITASKSKHAKCARCWNHDESVGSDSNYPDLCERCISNLNMGEIRKYC